MCLGALGTQTAGSILRPAAYCGAVGFKPTYGVVSREGVIPLAWSMDHVGPITKTVEDAALLYEALRGETPSVGPPPDGHRFTVGIADRYFDTDDRHVVAAFESALAAVAELGWTVKPVRLPASFEVAAQAAMVVITVEIAAVHEDWFSGQPDAYGPQLRELIEAGQRILAPTYLRAQRLRRQAAEEMTALFDGMDVLMTPTTPAPAPPASRPPATLPTTSPSRASGCRPSRFPSRPRPRIFRSGCSSSPTITGTNGCSRQAADSTAR